MECDYCTDDAIGLDEHERPTCGSADCEPIESPLPDIIEVSDDEGDEDESE